MDTFVLSQRNCSLRLDNSHKIRQKIRTIRTNSQIRTNLYTTKQHTQNFVMGVLWMMGAGSDDENFLTSSGVICEGAFLLSRGRKPIRIYITGVLL